MDGQRSEQAQGQNRYQSHGRGKDKRCFQGNAQGNEGRQDEAETEGDSEEHELFFKGLLNAFKKSGDMRACRSDAAKAGEQDREREPVAIGYGEQPVEQEAVCRDDKRQQGKSEAHAFDTRQFWWRGRIAFFRFRNRLIRFQNVKRLFSDQVFFAHESVGNR